MKHTHGPWLVRYNSVTTALNLRIVDCDERPVCEFPDPIYANERNGIKSERESIANAALIAAAPELLSALENLIENLPNDVTGQHGLIEATLGAVAVIKKVKGDQ
jgi:hypothetical protein